MKHYLTIGFHREDGDFDVVATFNMNTLLNREGEAAASELQRHAEKLAFDLGAEVLERQDADDVITLQ